MGSVYSGKLCLFAVILCIHFMFERFSFLETHALHYIFLLQLKAVKYWLRNVNQVGEILIVINHQSSLKY